MALSSKDPSSIANSEDYVTDHLHFDWTVDFDKEIIDGSVTLTLTNISKSQNDLKLDTKYLDIKEVSMKGEKLDFKIIPGKVEALGSCLSIPIKSVEEKLTIVIKYATTNKCTALQWLDPPTTLGKKYPYLFSQCQAIHARSMFPCQDTPSVKSTYSAEVRAQNHFNVLMSAIKTDEPTSKDNVLIHKFEQKIKIPSYLVALVCGHLESRKVGPRSSVWCEPEMIEKAAQEFSDTEQLLSIAEEICGPYVWGRYDLLVLPPSFPYGGMENPCLTFVTPTLLVGDKSLVFVVAHEITHSWTGNLVTNMNWEDFWLNEGHTRYVERLIMEKYHNSEPMRHLLIDVGLADLQESLNAFGQGHPFTQLVPKLHECDPDDSFSRVPYEKGSNLLFHLESICGKDKMIRWLKAYFDKYKFSSLTTKEWKDFFYEYMTGKEQISVDKLNNVNWNEWFYGRWTIPVTHDLNRDFAIRVEQLADKWISLKDVSVKDEAELSKEYQAMLPDQKYYLLQVLNDFKKAELPHNVLEKMGNLYGYATSTNSEILFGWSMLCIRSRFTCALDQIFEFLNSQGRLKFSKPLYKELHNWPSESVKQRTIDNFLKMMSQLHPILVNLVKQILGLKD